MKYLYVLVGAKKGFYCEQTLVSMLSLKNIDPEAYITLLVDAQTDADFKESIGKLRKFISEYIVVPVTENISPMARSRYIKTSMRKFVNGDFLYVDGDTLWNAPVCEDDFTHDIMGVLDGHCLLTNHPLKESIEEDFQKTNCNPHVEKYINGGVLYSKDSDVSRSFFENWHNKWRETSSGGCLIDMPALNYAIRCSGESFSLLPDSYNVQISRSWRYFMQSKVIHFYTGWQDEFFESPYLFQKRPFWLGVQNNGVDESAMKAICHPLTAFDESFGVFGLSEMKFRHTALYGFIADLFSKRNEKMTFNLLEKMIKGIVKFWR